MSYLNALYQSVLIHTVKLHYIEPQGTGVNGSIYPRFKISQSIYGCSIKLEVQNTEVRYTKVLLYTL